MLAVITAMALAFFLRPSVEWVRAGIVAGAILVALLIANPALQYRDYRAFSVSQLTSNIVSIVGRGSSEDASLARNRDYRLNWWSDIISYTFGGQYFLVGKGFGVNLADDDGFQVTGDGSLRAPHNTHMTFLARMGVPGFLLWICLNLMYALSLLGSIRRSRRANDDQAAEIKIWLLAIWIASLVNTTFDPYLEGPQGAIPFWIFFGLGIAMIKNERKEREGVESTTLLKLVSSAQARAVTQ
jgi:O-antigen ligase